MDKNRKFIDYLPFIKGEKNGEIVWVCDFRFLNGLEKRPIRHLKPTRCEVVSTDTYPDIIFYGSQSCLLPFEKNGKRGRAISFRDNTIQGTCVNIFYNEEDCVNYYNFLVEKYIWEWEEIRDRAWGLANEKLMEMKKNLITRK